MTYTKVLRQPLRHPIVGMTVPPDIDILLQMLRHQCRLEAFSMYAPMGMVKARLEAIPIKSINHDRDIFGLACGW